MRLICISLMLALSGGAMAGGNSNSNNSDTIYNSGDTNIEIVNKNTQGSSQTGGNQVIKDNHTSQNVGDIKLNGGDTNVSTVVKGGNTNVTTGDNIVKGGNTNVTTGDNIVKGGNTSVTTGANTIKGGNSSQITGDSNSSQTVGSSNSSVTAGDSNSSQVDNSQIIFGGDITPEVASSTAAVLAQQCQEGMSGQGITGGLSAIFDSAQCSYLRQASVHFEMAAFYQEKGMPANADLEEQRALEYIRKADQAVDFQTPTKAVGGALVSLLPITALFLLF